MTNVLAVQAGRPEFEPPAWQHASVIPVLGGRWVPQCGGGDSRSLDLMSQSSQMCKLQGQ